MPILICSAPEGFIAPRISPPGEVSRARVRGGTWLHPPQRAQAAPSACEPLPSRVCGDAVEWPWLALRHRDETELESCHRSLRRPAREVTIAEAPGARTNIRDRGVIKPAGYELIAHQPAE